MTKTIDLPPIGFGTALANGKQAAEAMKNARHRKRLAPSRLGWVLISIFSQWLKMLYQEQKI